MNINALLGTISFVLWTSFSVWFYVNNIYEFDTVKEYVNVSKSIEKNEVTTSMVSDAKVDIKDEIEVVNKEVIDISAKADVINNETKTSEKTAEAPKLTAINIEKEFIFHKNSDRLVDQAAFDEFVKTLTTTIADRKVSIQIVGYTCDLGTNGFNDQLGLKRANAVAKALHSPTALETTFEVESKGEVDPIVPNDSEENRSKNRRVSIIISSVL